MLHSLPPCGPPLATYSRATGASQIYHLYKCLRASAFAKPFSWPHVMELAPPRPLVDAACLLLLLPGPRQSLPLPGTTIAMFESSFAGVCVSETCLLGIEQSFYFSTKCISLLGVHLQRMGLAMGSRILPDGRQYWGCLAGDPSP